MSGNYQFVYRVNQVDAVTLDKEISQLLRSNFLENLQAIAPELFIKIQPELDFIICSAIWLGSVGKKRATFGQQLLVLAYDSQHISNLNFALHFCLTVLPSYLKSIDELRSHSMPNWFNKVTKWRTNITSLLDILNWFRFLKNGRKPTLVDFVLNMDYISLKENQKRSIGYRHLTWELLWGGFLEIISFAFLIINFRKINLITKGLLSKILRIRKKGAFKGNSYIMHAKPELFDNTFCSYCAERPILPYFMNCAHIYCYYCLAANLVTDSKFYCTKCDTEYSAASIKAL